MQIEFWTQNQQKASQFVTI